MLFVEQGREGGKFLFVDDVDVVINVVDVGLAFYAVVDVLRYSLLSKEIVCWLIDCWYS